MAEPLKDQFDRQTVELLAKKFAAAYPPFDSDGFVTDMTEAFPALELKARVNLVADRLAADLPHDYTAALEIVVEVARSGVEGFDAWPLCSFVERHGVDRPKASLDAMADLTKQWTCEFAIRPFLESHLAMTRKYLRRWSTDADEAVRRLPSEGTRPLLPWAPKVPALLDDPQIGLELLHVMRHDESETVRRSVANHLNDVAKAHPDLVVEILGEWQAKSGGADAAMVRHALRTLVKQGHHGAMGLLGFTVNPEVEIVEFSCAPETISLGAEIELAASVTSTSDTHQVLVVDFVVHHVKASGAHTPKVFKWTTLELAPKQTVVLTKRRRIQTATTRQYYAGTHPIDLQIAGQAFASTGFELTESS